MANCIVKAIKKKKAVRKTLGIKKDKTISAKNLVKAIKDQGKEGKRARLAKVLRALRNRK